MKDAVIDSGATHNFLFQFIPFSNDSCLPEAFQAAQCEMTLIGKGTVPISIYGGIIQDAYVLLYFHATLSHISYLPILKW